MKVKGVVAVIVFFVGLFLAACSDMGERDNPTDPSADNYDASLVPGGDDSGNGSEGNGEGGDSEGGKGNEDASSSSVEKNASSSSGASSSSDKTGSTSSSGTVVKVEEGLLKDERDGQTYRTVKIGNQTWMAENLNYRLLQKTSSLDSSSFCYNEELAKCEKYGRLYLWSAAMDSAATFSTDGKDCGYDMTCGVVEQVRGVCPEGWRLPSEEDFLTLFETIGGKSTAGINLKSINDWKLIADNRGNDSYKFTVLPGGQRNGLGVYEEESAGGYIWSMTEASAKFAAGPNFRYTDAGAILQKSNLSKNVSRSVRCIKNDSAASVASSSSAATSSSSSAKETSSSTAATSSSSSVTSQSSSSSAKSSSSTVSSSSQVNSSSSNTSQSSSSSINVSSSSSSSSWNEAMSTMVDSRDGQVYKIVTIGTQTWMAQNLNYETENSSCFDDDPASCDEYGRYYTWAAAMDSAGLWSANAKGCGYGKTCVPFYPVQGVCPEGWHLPRLVEWRTLCATVGGESMECGKMLKSTSDWNYYNAIKGDGTDDYGFSAFPVSHKVNGLYVASVGGFADFWISSVYDDKTQTTYARLEYNSDYLSAGSVQYKNYGMPVRCLQDSPEPEIQVPTSTMTDTRDDQTYKTVTIGTQTWMAQNLNYETVNSYCYDDDPVNCTRYGRLYKWADAMDSAGTWSNNGKGCGYPGFCSPTYPVRGICPSGWHLPSNAEWETLITTVGGNLVAGTMLRTTSGWMNDRDGLDSYGFSAFPSGLRRDDGSYANNGLLAFYWSSNEGDDSYDYWAYLMRTGDYEGASVSSGDKYDFYSVRCVQND